MKAYKKLLIILSTAFLLTGCNNADSDKDNKKTSGSETTSQTTSTTGSGSLPPVVPVSEYYKNITDSLSGGADGELRQKLTALIKPYEVPTYGGNGGGYRLTNELQNADEDPNNSSNMIFFYTQESKVKGKSDGAAYWNREHVWPQANSNGCWGQEDAGADMLHIRPTYEETNLARGNLKYGKVSGSYQTYNGYQYGKIGTYFEPTDQVKGDAARICMYVWVAWYDHYGKNKIPALTNVFESIATMLEWHLQDTPSQQELNRNNYVQNSRQRNRNPFVDHPEYACRIWGNTNSTTKSLCGM